MKQTTLKIFPENYEVSRTLELLSPTRKNRQVWKLIFDAVRPLWGRRCVKTFCVFNFNVFMYYIMCVYVRCEVGSELN